MIRQVTPDGHADAVWRATIDSLPRTASGALRERDPGSGPVRRVLVVSAHPDDETLGGGRLLADWAAAGVEVTAVVATAGEACFDVVGHREPDLAATRLAEWRRALDVLGVRPSGCLGLPDGDLSAHENALRRALGDLVGEVRPDVIAGTLDVDPHPDHQAVGRSVRQVARERALSSLGWPVWLTYAANPPGPAGLEVVECSADAELARARAWECFTSQREPIASDISPVVPPELVSLLSEQIIARESSS